MDGDDGTHEEDQERSRSKDEHPVHQSIRRPEAEDGGGRLPRLVAGESQLDVEEDGGPAGTEEEEEEDEAGGLQCEPRPLGSE